MNISTQMDVLLEILIINKEENTDRDILGGRFLLFMLPRVELKNKTNAIYFLVGLTKPGPQKERRRIGMSLRAKRETQ